MDYRKEARREELVLWDEYRKLFSQLNLIGGSCTIRSLTPRSNWKFWTTKF